MHRGASSHYYLRSRLLQVSEVVTRATTGAALRFSFNAASPGGQDMANRLDAMNPTMTSTPPINQTAKSTGPARAAANGNVIKRYVHIPTVQLGKA